MAFLTLSGLTIPVMQDNAGQEYEEHGIDRARMFDGTMRQIRRGIFRKWSITTKYLDASDYLTLVALLESNSLPMIASGDLLDGEEVGVFVQLLSASPKATAQGFKRRVVFTMWESGGPLPADRSAVPLMAFLRGMGYKTGDWGTGDHAAVVALANATNGDLISAWLDQSGNDIHLLGGVNQNFLNFDSRYAPQRDASKVRFGLGGVGGDPRTFFTLVSTGYDESAAIGSLTGIDISVGVQAYDATPLTDTGNSLWLLGGTGNTGGGAALYPKASDGHIWESCGTNEIVDCGVATNLDELNHYRVVVEPSGSNNFRVYVNGALQHEETRGAVDFSGFTIGAASGYFNGWIRDLIVFPVTRTTRQAASWDDYILGVTDDAPLPE